MTPPPIGPIRAPGEYEPMDGILLSYEGSGDWLAILDQMGAAITTTGGADVYVMADSNGEASTILTNMGAAGADVSRVHPLVVATDTIWMRDYGPRYVYEGDVRVIIDHTYNRPRPNDNGLPSQFSAIKNHRLYELGLVHGGGNFHINGLGIGHATRLINNENPTLTEQEIIQIWSDYQGLDTQLYTPFPTFIDSTQHLDMWMQVIGHNEAIISDWPFDVGSTQDQICDNTAAALQKAGYTIHRIPARSVGGTHYTYTNVVMCNDLVLLPMYTNSQASQHNAEALAVWEAAVPNKTVVQINCQAIVTASGVMHCIAMHLPAPIGGQDPTVFIQSNFGGALFSGGQQQALNWISDDDEGTVEADILLSLDGGQTWPVNVLSGTQDDGFENLTMPDIFAINAKIRVVARDADGRTGSFDMPDSFIINGSRFCPADLFPNNGNGTFGDGLVDGNDLDEVMAHWGDGFGYYDIAPPLGNNHYGDGYVTIADMVEVITAMGACP